MNPTLEHFSDAELLAGARNAQSRADTLPTALAGPLQLASLAAELLGLAQALGGVIDLDVDGDLTRTAVLAGPDAPCDPHLAGLDEPVARPVSGVVDLPAEELGIEACRAGLARALVLDPEIILIDDPPLSSHRWRK